MSVTEDGGSSSGASRGVARSTTVRPVITTDAFSGDGSWNDWIGHFESVADGNGWDEASKLLWLRVQLTGQAQTAYKQLSETTRAMYEECKKVCGSDLNLPVSMICTSRSSRPGENAKMKIGRHTLKI